MKQEVNLFNAEKDKLDAQQTKMEQ